MQQLATFKPKDPSTNLNGAVVKALDELDNALGKATQPLKFGTLVVFTDGTDRANRVPGADMQQHIREKPFDVFAIGLGAEIKPDQLAEHRQERHGDGRRQERHREGVRRRAARRSRRARKQLLPALLLLARARRQARGPHRGRREGQPERQRDIGQPEERLRRHRLRAGLRPEHPADFDVTRGDALAPPPPPDKAKKADLHLTVKASVSTTTKASSPPHLPPPPPPKAEPAPAPATPPPPQTPPPPAQDFTP